MNKPPTLPEAERQHVVTEYDTHRPRWFNAVMQKVRKSSVQHQAAQQSQIESKFSTEKVKIHSIINNPDGTPEQTESAIEDFLAQPGKKIVWLWNGIVNPLDIVQLWNAEKQSKYAKIYDSIFKTRKRLTEEVGDQILPGNNFLDYIDNTVQRIRSDLFEKNPCNVLIVRNASRDDLLKTIKAGGDETVLVVGGHGSLGALAMTDGTISNAEIPTPQKKLKAFVQHTCAAPNDRREDMGTRWAERVYGWRRGTNPFDFTGNPLPLRTVHFDE